MSFTLFASSVFLKLLSDTLAGVLLFGLVLVAAVGCCSAAVSEVVVF